MNKPKIPTAGIREVTWVVAAQIAAVAGGFIGLKLLSNFLSLEQFGLYQLGWSAALIAGVCIFSPFGQTVIRLFPMQISSGNAEEFYGYTLVLLTKIVGILIVFFLLVYVGLANIFDWPFALGIAMLLSLIGHGTTQAFQDFQTALRQRPLFLASLVCTSFGRPLFAVLAIILLSDIMSGAAAGLAGTGLFLIVFLVVQNRFVKMGLRATTSQQLAAEATDSGVTVPGFMTVFKPMILIGILTVLSLYTDRWILTSTVEIGLIGIYAANYQIAGGMLNFVQGIANRLALPIIFQRFGLGANALDVQIATRQTTLMILVWTSILVVVAIASIFGHHVLVALLTTPEIASQSHLLPWLFVGLGLDRTAQIMTVKGNLELGIGRYIPARLLHILVIIVAGYLLSSEYGIIGFAWAHCVAGAAIVGAVLVVDRRS